MPEPDAAALPFFRVHRLGATPSTNTVGLELALSGEAGPLWILADTQTAGRGRSGRRWTSVPGNLYASLLLTFDRPLPELPQLALVAGVAAVDAITEVAGARPPAGLRLKWPNDILVGEAKLGGILVEGSTLPGTGRLAVVVGIGLNVAGVPEGLGRAATSLAALGIDTDRDRVLMALAAALDRWRALWDCSRGFPVVREGVLARAGPIGEPLTINAGDGAVDGVYAGIDIDGALILRLADGGLRRFTYGDVTIAPARGAGQVQRQDGTGRRNGTPTGEGNG